MALNFANTASGQSKKTITRRTRRLGQKSEVSEESREDVLASHDPAHGLYVDGQGAVEGRSQTGKGKRSRGMQQEEKQQDDISRIE
jgi:hypothetical protein